MSFTKIQSTGLTSGTTAITSLAPTLSTGTSGSNVTAGNLLIAHVHSGNAAVQTVTVTDTQGNTWNQLNGGSFRYGSTNIDTAAYFWCIANATGANTVTATIGTAATLLNVAIAEYSFAAKNFIQPDTMSLGYVNLSGASATCGTQPLWNLGNCLALAGTSQGTTSGSAWTAPSGWTSLYNSTYASGTNTNGFMFAALANTSGALTPTFTCASAVNWRSSVAALRETPYSLAIQGPTSGAASVASTTFTITPNAALTDTISFSDGSSGTFTPSSLSWVNSSAPKTFTYTPPASFTYVTLSFTSSAGYVLYDSTRTYTNSALQYYVSAAGSDSNNGTSTSTPWLTIAHALSTITVPGVTLNLRGGDTFSENPSLTQGITIQNYGTGQATIAGGTTAAVTFTNCDNIKLSNLILTGASAAFVNVNTGVIWGNGTDTTRRSMGVTITGCTVSGAGSIGIVLWQTTTSAGGWNNVSISNNVVHNCVYGGITVSGSHTGSSHYSGVTVSGNTVHDITGENSGTYNSGQGIIIGSCDDITVGTNYLIYNYVYSLAANRGVAAAGGGPAAIFPVYSQGVISEFNVAHDINSTTDNVDGAAFDIDINNHNCIIRYNLSYNCGGAGLFGFGTITGSVPHDISWNVSINDGLTNEGGISLALANYNVYNNTVVAKGTGSALVVTNGCLGVVANNILISASGVASANFGIITFGATLQGNAYLSGTSSFLCTAAGGNSTSLAAWRTATGQETGSNGIALTGNPLQSTTVPSITPQNITPAIVFSPTTGSQPINTGLNLQSLYGINPGTTDFFGDTLTSPYSVGAINPAYTTASAVWTGPSSGPVKSASGTFTLTFASAYSGIVTPTDLSYGGSFTPSSRTLVSATTATFTYTPVITGTIPLSINTNNVVLIGSSPISFTSLLGFTLSGPTSGTVGTTSSNFTVTPTAPYVGTVTPSDGGQGGTFTPSTLTFTGLSTAQTFTYNPAISGTISISISSSPASVYSGSPISFVSSSSGGGGTPQGITTLSGPATGVIGVASTFTVSLTQPYTGIVTMGDSNTGGTFNPTSLTFNSSSTSQTFTYTPAQSGNIGIYIYINPPNLDSRKRVFLLVSIPAATTATLSGPTTGVVGNGSTNFTVALNGTYSGTITPSDSSGGGTFTPAQITMTGGTGPVTFGYTPGSVGTKSISIVASPSLALSGSPVSMVVSAAQSYVLTGPSSGTIGFNSTDFTITPNGQVVNDIITFSDSGAGGYFKPYINGQLLNLPFNSKTTLAQTFKYLPRKTGAITITLTSARGGVITGSPFTYTSNALTANVPYVNYMYSPTGNN